MEQEDFIKESVTVVSAEEIMKVPWKYYGKLVQFTGTVAMVQMYPPNSDAANIIANGGECGEILVYDEYEVYTSNFFIGDISDISEGDSIIVVGLPIG